MWSHKMLRSFIVKVYVLGYFTLLIFKNVYNWLGITDIIRY